MPVSPPQLWGKSSIPQAGPEPSDECQRTEKQGISTVTPATRPLLCRTFLTAEPAAGPLRLPCSQHGPCRPPLLSPSLGLSTFPHLLGPIFLIRSPFLGLLPLPGNSHFILYSAARNLKNGNLILLPSRLNLQWLPPTQDGAKRTVPSGPAIPAGHLSHTILPRCLGLRVSTHTSTLCLTSSLGSGLLQAEPPTFSSSWDLVLGERA